ncbi:piggyBac transposable element-derived protein 4-like [Aphis craccivora]|uniref:PiggyBac transposable element-derived protein 4-like n=1 Tax=Aphis craccivora TaxID=307492 RepID=A0A6G0VL17_APHCR|nr:piggyBac transposable element-derived protein 4-like [Aphis craccivora]
MSSETIINWLDEVDDEISDAESIVSDHESEYEQVISEVPEDETDSSEYSSNETPFPQRRTRSDNIISHLPGVVGSAKIINSSNPIDFWNILFYNTMIEKVTDYTNVKITELSISYGNTSTFTGHTGIIEIKAFIGLLYLCGIFKSGMEDVGLFATDDTGRDIFRATMSLKRFLFLLSTIRFDNIYDRDDRKESGDRVAPISELFQMFLVNSQSNYSTSEYSTVDEILVPFRGRCSFRMYMKSKPNKYGLKVMCLCDAKNHYLYNAFIYCGKNNVPNPKKNITGDNWFSSIELITELKRHGLTYVGTLRKNKRDIPSQIVPNKQTEVNTTKFAFTKDITLLSFVPKNNRYVLLFSSMHHTNTINLENSKPEIIEFYNQTKVGVDALDQKCAVYSTHRRIRSWPLVIFYVMLDIASVNSRLQNINSPIPRRKFGIIIGKELIIPHMKRRLLQERLPREIPQIIKRILGDNTVEATQEISSNLNKRRRCCVCPSSKDTKYSNICSVCKKTVCKTHGVQVSKCVNCMDTE